jgi:hypothetical protein
MHDHESDPLFERAAALLRRPSSLDAAARDRVIAAVRREPPPRRSAFIELFRARPVRLSPLLGAALAAGLVGVGVLIGARDIVGGRAPIAADGASAVRADTVQLVQFVLVAPKAQRVALVGEFNDWDAAATPMRASAEGGLWAVTLPLTPGRHVYAFVVDGSTWTADPQAPMAPEDGFGTKNSVIVVGGKSST